MKSVLVIAGTRPEAVKMAPVVHALRSRPDDFTAYLCSSGQHQQMLEQTFADFSLVPDFCLDVMASNQSLAGLSARLFTAVDSLLDRLMPDVVLVQGDTTTVQVSALCAFYRGISVGHVEAGLRTWNNHSPFPEEINRRIACLAARWHYAPTEAARRNLLMERIDPANVLVAGNTVIDALLMTLKTIRKAPPPLPPRVEMALAAGRPLILVTGHRRESFGQGFKNVCTAVRQIAAALPDACLVYPVHLNPNVSGPVGSRLGDVPNVILESPLPYKAFVRLMDSCSLILTDSGGIQEEAPSLGKPVLVMRDVTERPEGIEAGVNQLVGTDPQRIVDAVLQFMRDSVGKARKMQIKNPYGDGLAAKRIVEHLAVQ